MHSFFEPLTDEQKKLIYGEFNATEESLKNDAKSLVEWMEMQPHLPNVTDEEFLANFLLRCKNSMERTKQQLDMYYTNRALNPEIFLSRGLKSEEFLKMAESVTLVTVPKLTPEGYRVWIYEMADNVKNYQPSPDALLRAITLLLDTNLKADINRSAIVIFNLENMTLAYSSVVFSVLKKLVEFTTKVSPFRFHKLYVVNLLPAFEALVTVAKTFMKKKLAQRIEVWTGKQKELVQVISEDVLPEEYGGKEKPVLEVKEVAMQAMFELEDWIESEKSMVADLTKRPGGKDISEYGVEGTFRKIIID